MLYVSIVAVLEHFVLYNTRNKEIEKKTQPNNGEVKWQHKDNTKTFDYTMIADRLRTVSSNNYCHRTGVVKSVYGIQTFPLTAKAV